MITEVEQTTSGEYAQRAHAQLDAVRQLLADASAFKPTRYSQWQILMDGRLVECGYVYGEPWAKILSPDGRRELDHFKFNGRDREELKRFLLAVTC